MKCCGVDPDAIARDPAVDETFERSLESLQQRGIVAQPCSQASLVVSPQKPAAPPESPARSEDANFVLAIPHALEAMPGVYGGRRG